MHQAGAHWQWPPPTAPAGHIQGAACLAPWRARWAVTQGGIGMLSASLTQQLLSSTTGTRLAAQQPVRAGAGHDLCLRQEGHVPAGRAAVPVLHHTRAQPGSSTSSAEASVPGQPASPRSSVLLVCQQVHCCAEPACIEHTTRGAAVDSLQALQAVRHQLVPVGGLIARQRWGLRRRHGCFCHQPGQLLRGGRLALASASLGG
jgi:hypothetical protein